MNRPRLVRVALMLCDGVVRVHPPAFRSRFGAAMRDDFRRLADEPQREGWRRGRAARAARLLVRALRDLVRSVPREWVRAWGRRGSGASWSSDVGAFMAGVGRDVRWAFRSLGRDRGFSLVTVAVLSLGIGANLAVFGLVRAYLLRPLPFPESERLVAVSPVVPVPWTGAEEIFEIPVSWDLDAFTILGDPRTERVRGAWVTPGFFEAFGIRPALGRGIASEPGREGGSVAVISHRLWQERFGGDPDVLGRTLTTFSSDRPDDAESFTVVGVLPRDFWFFHEFTEILVPLQAENPIYMGRLRADVPLERAGAMLADQARPRMEEVPADFRVDVVPYHHRYVQGVRPILVVLWISVALVLLIACGNAAVLLLVRAAGRGPELSVRQALGAGKGAIARQLMVEGLVLAGIAAGLGTVLGWAAIEGLAGPAQAHLGLSAPGGPEAVRVDGALLALSCGLALLTGIVFGLVPLLGAAGGSLHALAARGRGNSDSPGRRRLRWGLVGGELALSLALLIASGLAVRSALYVATLDLGFDPGGVVKAEVNLRQRSYPEAADRIAFFDGLVEEVRAIPSVAAAGAAIRVPFTWFFAGAPVEAEGREVTDPSRAPVASGQIVGPGYFDAMGIPVLRGRGFTAVEAGDDPVAVVSEMLAARLWPDQDPLGRRLRDLPTIGAQAHGEAEPGAWRRVVGVVPDVRKSLEAEHVPDYYVPYQQVTPTSMSVVMRVREGGPSPIPDLERAVRALDPAVAVSAVASLEDATADARLPARFLAGILTGFGAFAVVLAVLGLYGVVSYATSQRRRDVAIRMALGADARRVVRSFLTEGAAVVLAGMLVGLIAARTLARLLAGQLHGVDPGDITTYGLLAILLAVSAMAATWWPARQAARADPMRVLREE